MQAKILIVDDDPSTLALEERILQREGYQVLIAVNGLQALREAMAEEPNLIILDLMLPGMDGFEICECLRNSQETSSVPVLVLSAKGREVDKTAALESGADAYLAKPVSVSRLLGQVEDMLAQKEECGS